MDIISELLYPSERTLWIFNLFFISLIIGCVVVAGAFIFVYSRFPWKRKPAGVATMWLLRSLFGIFLVAGLARFNPEYPGRLIVTAVIFGLVFITLIRLLWTLVLGYAVRAEPGHRIEKAAENFDDTIPGHRN